MLVVSRTEGEAVTLPDLDVAVRVLRVAGSRVRLGVEAPREVRVLRNELEPHAPQALTPEENQRREALQEQLAAVQIELVRAQNLLHRGEIAAAEQLVGTAAAKLAATELNSAAGNPASSPETISFPNEAAVYAVTRRTESELQVRESNGETQFFTRISIDEQATHWLVRSDSEGYLVC